MTRTNGELTVSNEFYRVLVETMTDAITLLGIDGTIQYSSPSIERLTGFTPDERSGRPALEHVHPDDVQRIAAVMDRARGGHRSFERLEYRIRHADGTWRHVESHGRSLRPSDPDAPWVIVSRDVSGRYEAVQALQASEARFQALVEHAAIGIYHTTRGGQILDANPSLVRMLGYDSVDAVLALNIGRDVWMNAQERADLLPEPSGVLKQVEVQWRRKDGSLITVRLHGRAISGDPVVYETFAEDVSEQRLMEEQIRQSLKMEALGRLAGGVAHDFNNLLSSILGYSELLSEQIPVGDPRYDDVQEVRRAGEKAATLTRQLLAYSRKQVVQPTLMDVNAALMGMADVLRSAVGSHIDVQIQVAPGVPPIMADPSQLERIFANLAVNARDAMPGGGTLIFETAHCNVGAAAAHRETGLLPGPYVLLIVSDNGRGLDEDAKARLFEPFFTTKERGKGAGLGLATVYGAVRQSGGVIRVYSQPGQGTTFKIFLPVASAGGTVIEANPVPLPREGSETILLVEDDDPVRELAARVLRRFGYRVMPAASAHEAEALFADHRHEIHLLLTDVMMPLVGGIELARRLTALAPALPVVFMSGYTDDAFASRGAADPTFTLVAKPFTPEALATRVRQVLDRK